MMEEIYHVAIVWHAATNIGTPRVWYRGPRADDIAENKAGY